MSNLNGLLPLLQRLDQLLEQAIAAAQLAFGTETTADPYRGMHVTDKDVNSLLAREPGFPIFTGYGNLLTEVSPIVVPQGSRLEWLQQTFCLSNFDLDVVAIALAPELDRRYERLYIYLQDDVRSKRPTVDLALNLLCGDAASKLARRAHFIAAAPLMQQRLLHPIADSNSAKSSLLAHELYLDDSVTRFLLAQPGLDERLTPFCQMIQRVQMPEEMLLNPQITRSLTHLTNQALQQKTPLRLYFQGLDRSGKRYTVAAIAHHLKSSLLIVDVARLVVVKDTLEITLKLLFREALFQQSVLYLDGIDAFRTADLALAYQILLTELANAPNVIILSGTQPWVPGSDQPLGVLSIPFPMPDVQQCKSYWQYYLGIADCSLSETELNDLASRFRLTSDQIAEAVAVACNAMRWQQNQIASDQVSAALDSLFAAARAQCGYELQDLAHKIEPKYTWNDIVLPSLQRAQLQEIFNQARYHNRVFSEWGFERKLSSGLGLNVLFTGLPGTGKTMAAEVLAHELQLDLYRIDLSQIVSKYIGETEKNLNRIFTAAANSNAILLFDEADALFGKRSDVKDAHDRYANIEVGYLLQKMEEYNGMAILTTNLRSNIDEAFVRRLRFIIDFPLPNRTSRYIIWKQVFPETVPCDPHLDLKFLAEQFEITGAAIRNIALASAFLAAADNDQITMEHIAHALRRECQKTGTILMGSQLDDYSRPE